MRGRNQTACGCKIQLAGFSLIFKHGGLGLQRDSPSSSSFFGARISVIPVFIRRWSSLVHPKFFRISPVGCYLSLILFP